jgi:hypothetical protein
MTNDRYARWGAASGIVAIVLIVVGFFIGTSDLPDIDAPANEWLSFVTDNQSEIQWGTSIVAVGVFFFIWFLGSLRSALRAAEGGTGRLASITFASGVVIAGFFLLVITAIQAAAFRSDASADTVRGLWDLSTVAGAPAVGAFTAFFAATAIAGYRHNALPAPVAGLSALAAITQPLALGVGVTDSGAFAGDGVLGFWVPFWTLVIGVVALSVTLMRQPTPAGATRT